MKLFRKLKASIVWFTLPALFVVGMVGLAVSGYEPLIFDPALVEQAQAAQAAQVAKLKEHDPKKEATSSKSAETSASSASAASAASSASAPAPAAATGDGTQTAAPTIASGGNTQTAAQVPAAEVATPSENASTSTAAAKKPKKAKSAAASGTKVKKPSKPSKSGNSDDSSDSGAEGKPGKPEDSGSTDNPGVVDNPGDSSSPDDPGNTDDTGDTGDEPAVVEVLVDGTYTGHAFCKDLEDPRSWSPYYMIVDIQVAGGKVAAIADVYADAEGVIDPNFKYNSSENATYLKFAIDGVGRRVKGMKAKMQEAIEAGTDPSAVDVVSSATWSSRAILEAYANAVASVPHVQEVQGE